MVFLQHHAREWPGAGIPPEAIVPVIVLIEKLAVTFQAFFGLPAILLVCTLLQCTSEPKEMRFPLNLLPLFVQAGQSTPPLFVFPLDAFAAKVPWAPFLVQTRPEKRPFRAKTRPRLQSERREGPFCCKCVQPAGGGGVTRPVIKHESLPEPPFFAIFETAKQTLNL